MGETIGGVIPEYYVWLFSEAWPGNLMTKGQTNKGWYYFNIAPDKIATNGMDGSTKTIIPGETLMMFNSGGDVRTDIAAPITSIRVYSCLTMKTVRGGCSTTRCVPHITAYMTCGLK